MSNCKKLEKYMKEAAGIDVDIKYGRAPGCCSIPEDGGSIPYGYYTNHGNRSKYLGKKFTDAVNSLDFLYFDEIQNY